MKKLIALLLVLILLPVCAFSEFLSENERQYLGSWVMYIVKGETTYLYTITFFDDGIVRAHFLTFKKSALVSSRDKSGQWCGFTSEIILLSLADQSYLGRINEEGRLVVAIYGESAASGIYSRCEDLSFLMN